MDSAFLLIFIGFIALVIGAPVLSYLAKKKRREGFALVARQLGMEYWPEDPFGLLAEPFALVPEGRRARDRERARRARTRPST